MKNQRFGIEIELTGITREAAANIIASYFGTSAKHEGGSYQVWSAKDRQGRTWKAMHDASISPRLQNGQIASREYACEIVSPILNYEDIESLQEIVRLLRKAGAIANESCGIHVHVDAAPFTAKQLRNLANLFASREQMIAHALDIKASRQRYCQLSESRFMERINQQKTPTMDSFAATWYNGNDERHIHYSSTRYRMLNFHSTFSKGTVEFRCFNSTTHAGAIKSYIQFCLAVTHQAQTQRSATYRSVITDNEKYAFRCWLLRLGLIGDEFKTARFHLMKHLEGNSAWRHVA
jgi:hypothetical protein